MGNSYTDNLKLREPAVGDLNWGDEVNENTSLLSAGISNHNLNNKVITGLEVTDGGTFTANIGLGRAFVGGTEFTIDATTKACTPAGVVGQRQINFIYVDSGGAIQQATTAPIGEYVLLAVVDTSNTDIDRVGDWRPQNSESVLFAIDKIVASSANVVDVFLYDTSKDSDNGVWRERTSHLSWFTQNGKFSALPLIVGDGGAGDLVSIYDTTISTVTLWDSWVVTNPSSVDMINGQMVVGTDTGLIIFDFVGDAVYRYDTTDFSKADQNIKDFDHSTVSWSTVSVNPIVNNTVNDVAMTVLPDAPVDPATGLPTPTIAVATDVGISVITDGGVVFDSGVAVGINSVSIDINHRLFFGHASSPNVRTINIQDISGDGFTNYLTYNNGTIPSTTLGNAHKTDGVFLGNSLGLTILDEDTVTPANGMVAYITTTYNTGLMQGDIELCLSGNSLTDRSVSSTVVTDNGIAIFAEVSTSTDLQSTTASGGTITAPVTTGGECYGYEKVAGIWIFREKITDWVGVSEAAGTLTIADGTIFTLLKYVNGAGPNGVQLDDIDVFESKLFSAGTKSLLLGSNAIQALSHNPDTNETYVSTADGTNVFQGGVRVNYIDNTGVSTDDDIQAVSAVRDIYAIGTAAETVINQLAINLREKLINDGPDVTGAELIKESLALNPAIPSKLDSADGVLTCTLGNGQFLGQMKVIAMTDATNSSTVSVTNHETTDPEVITFAAVDDTAVLMWTLTEWITIKLSGATV